MKIYILTKAVYNGIDHAPAFYDYRAGFWTLDMAQAAAEEEFRQLTKLEAAPPGQLNWNYQAACTDGFFPNQKQVFAYRIFEEEI